MKKNKSYCKQNLHFIGKLLLFIGIIAAFYKLPSTLADRYFSHTIKHRKYQQILED